MSADIESTRTGETKSKLEPGRFGGQGGHSEVVASELRLEGEKAWRAYEELGEQCSEQREPQVQRP